MEVTFLSFTTRHARVKKAQKSDKTSAIGLRISELLCCKHSRLVYETLELVYSAAPLELDVAVLRR